MSSIFDQYEATMSSVRSSQKPSRSSSSASTAHELVTSGYINATADDETPIFTKNKINFKPDGQVTHLAICNNMLCMVLSGRLLLRINLLHPDDMDEVEIARGDDRVYKMYFDPTGHFLLLTLSSEETVFLAANSRKPKTLNKFKGHKIESIAWCQTSCANTTGPVLVGTNWGLIMECSIEAGEDTKFFGGSVDQYFKQVYSLEKGERGSPITGLEYFCTASRGGGKNEYCIFASTPSRFYQFSGVANISSGDVPVFQTVFAPYQAAPPRHIDLPGLMSNSQLILLYDMKSSSALIPTQFAWMAAPGVYVGDVRVPATTDESYLHQRSLIANARLISYPDTVDDNDNPFAETNSTVLNIALTNFHLLLLYSDRLKVICSLNEQLIFEDVYSSRFGQLMGLVKDPVQSTVWTFTEKTVYKYKVVKESRDVWQMYLDMGKFDLAREYCRDNPANLDQVQTRRAEHAFENGQYQESAMYYASTQNSFEEVALKFLRSGKEVALRVFLQKKLSNVKPEETTQMTMLSTWLIELYLNELGKLRDNSEENQKEASQRCWENLRKFLAQGRLKQCFQENRATIYDLLISHGDIENYVFFAVLMQDYERVVNHHVQNEDYVAALEALRKQQNILLFYKFSPMLMQRIPTLTVDAWIHLGQKLDPKRLIPSLINCTQSGQREQWLEALRYLEFSIRELKCRDSAIHNYLLSLYVAHQPESIIGYLKDQGSEASDVCYDTKYALRLCLAKDASKLSPELIHACVKIYTVMNLFEEAVAMALKVDVELAKSIADLPELEEEDEEMRKKLWLRIAKHVVQEEKDIKRAMKFLQESGDLLKIEDILPFFPDFVTIDHFKDALCESLAEYNKHIDLLKDEMNEATSSAHSIRANIQETRNQHLVVGPTEVCKSCNRQLLSRGFYLFPCQHAFHSDCLWNEVRPMLNETKRDTADRLQQELRFLNQSTATGEQALRERKARRQQLIVELDETIATECVLCGEIAVRAIELPFVGDSDESSSWA